MEDILHIFGVIMLILAFSISCYNTGYKNGVDDATKIDSDEDLHDEV